jgi:hypothetical protein
MDIEPTPAGYSPSRHQGEVANTTLA